MEKETKRALLNLLEIIREQQNTIRDLQHKAMPSTRGIPDGIAERIGRIAEAVAEHESYEIDWPRLCDRHYAARS